MIKNSGIGVYVRHFVAKLLSDDELKVILIGRKEELKPFFDLERLDYIEANFPIYSIAEQLRLPKLIPNCDLFWAPHYNVPLLPINSKRFLVTVPDVFHLAFCKTLSIKQQIYAKVVLNMAVRISNKIITISNYSKEEILQYTNIEESKVSVIHLGINKSKFFRRDDLARQWVVRKRYNIPEKYILFVGNVKPNKNLRSLVKAFSLLKDRLPDHKLLIAGKKEGFITGDGQLFDEINNNSLLQERVAFTGYVTDEDLPYLYSMASLFAFPSIYEGFGFPPLEAMACGCAVIASNLASIPEVCGDAAVYVDPYDAEQFAAEIYRITNDHMLEADLILKGYRQVEKYSWDVAENAFMVEIRKLLQ